MTKENLIELYINQELSTRDIAKIYNVGQTTVRRKLSEFEIETRSSKEGKNTKTYQNKAKELSKYYKEEYSNRALKTGNRLKKYVQFVILNLKRQNQLIESIVLKNVKKLEQNSY